MRLDVSRYLLKTGPISLADLLTRVPELATDLPMLKGLAASGEIRIEGDEAALDTVIRAVQAAHEEAGGHPEAAQQHVLKSLDEIPGAKQLRICPSESAFRRAMR